MATVLESPVWDKMVVPTEPVKRFTVDEYHLMINAGFLDEDDTVELLEGYLVEKMPKNPPHGIATYSTREELEKVVPSEWYVDSQESITLSTSEPEPDVFVARGRRRDYIENHPGPKDIAIVIEIPDATLQRDRNTKKRVYAEASVPTYWLINLIDEQIEVYTEPVTPTTGPDYQLRRTYKRGEEIPVEMNGEAIAHLAIDSLLP